MVSSTLNLQVGNRGTYFLGISTFVFKYILTSRVPLSNILMENPLSYSVLKKNLILIIATFAGKIVQPSISILSNPLSSLALPKFFWILLLKINLTPMDSNLYLILSSISALKTGSEILKFVFNSFVLQFEKRDIIETNHFKIVFLLDFPS